MEDTASAQSAIQQLRRDSALPIIPVAAAGTTTVSRAEAVSPLLEAGRVLLPEQSPARLGPRVEEHVSFPTGRHDDQVDTTSMALGRLRSHGGGREPSIGGQPLFGDDVADPF